MNQSTRLIISESERGADMFYATHFRAPDPFAFVEHRGKKSILLSKLEIDRGQREACVDNVVSFSLLETQLAERLKRPPTNVEVTTAFIKKYGSSRVIVPHDFPLGLARELEKQGIVLRAMEDSFFPERALKRPDEIRALQRALRITEMGMARAHEILKATTIGKKKQLLWSGKPLTSEQLRQEVDSTMLRAGGIPAGDSIVAGGQQACDPHERGHGPLRANELIILDLFPRDAKSGYYGDLTRTVVRGTASEAQRHLWETCLAGQKQVLKSLKPGAAGKKMYQSLQDFFTSEGYPMQQKKGRWSGFFHSTGHSLGLDVHDGLRLEQTIFKPNHVFSIEPGLYIPGLGGVRHEDVIVITEKGYRMLSKFPKMLEL